MKKIMLVFFAVLIFSPLYAGTKIEYFKFNIGSADANIRFYTDSIFGARGDAVRTGGTVSTLDFNQSFTSYNPACLAFQKGATASFSGIPFEFLSSGSVGFFQNHDYALDFANLITRTASEKTTPTAATLDPDNAKLYFAQANGITGMEGMLPFAQNNAAIGVAREEKFGLSIGLLGEGISSEFGVFDGDNPAFYMSMSATAEFAADINLKSMVTSIGLGRRINPQWGVGAVLEYTDTRLIVDANADAQATGRVFLVPKAYEYGTNTTNSLAQYIKGELKAAAWALRVGTSFHAPDDVAEIAVDFSIQPRFKFGGDMAGVAHTLPTDSGIIASDLAAGETRTIEDPWNSDDYDIQMKLPSYFRATLAWKPGPAVIAFNYTRCFDALSFSYEGEGLEGLYSMVMSDAFRIGFNFEYFQLGGGVMFYQETIRMDDKVRQEGFETKNETMIPIASLGFVIPLGNFVKTEWELIAFPLPVLKTSFTVAF